MTHDWQAAIWRDQHRWVCTRCSLSVPGPGVPPMTHPASCWPYHPPLTDKTYIVGVAAVFGREVWTLPPPNRHHDLIWMRTLQGLRGSGEQGFLDSDGQFLTRRSAMYVARAAGQLIPRAGREESGHEDLFSEDLW